MPNPVFIFDEDLYKRIGGRPALTQLTDGKKTGTWNVETTARARFDACNIVLEAAGVQSDLGGYGATEFSSRFPNLVTYAVFKALYLTWLYGTSGQACPPNVIAFNQEADAGLERLAVRRRKGGAADFSPQPSQEVRGSIDNDPDGSRMTLAGWKTGFC